MLAAAALPLFVLGCATSEPIPTATVGGTGGTISVRYDVADAATQREVADACRAALVRQVDAFNVEYKPTEEGDGSRRCLQLHSHVLRAKWLG